ncbi:MAG: flavocytochrome c [Fusobacteriaceae bacterium]
MNKEYLTIGELSLKTSVTEKTIRFYSDKNMIVPDYINPKTNYRYYKSYQILKIKLIASLKDKGFSLKEIQNHLENPQTQKIEDFLKNHKNKLDEINKKIKELENIKKNIVYSMESLNIDSQEKIYVKSIPKRNFLYLDDDILSENIVNTFQILESTIGNGYAHLGNIISNSLDSKELPILIFQDEDNSNSSTIEKGTFLTINHSNNRTLALKKIFDFAEKNNLKIKENFYEVELINFFMTQNKKDYIKEIQIPIKVPESKKNILKDGLYQTFGFGYNGEINADITIFNNGIKTIRIKSHRETSIISAPAFEIISKLILQKKSIYVPNVSGCSYTSKGIKEAVLKALIMAGGDKEYLNYLFFKSNTLPKIGWDKDSSKNNEEDFDVIIIGSGAAGLAASIEAKKQGLSVGVFEKMPYIGGNTLLSLGTFVFPDFNNSNNLNNFKSDIFNVGRNINCNSLVDSFLKNLQNLENWLFKELNIELENDGILNIKLNNYFKKKLPGKYGVDLISCLKEKSINLGCQIFTNSVCKSLIYEENEIRGVIIEIKGIEKEIRAKKVILATGGFSQNISLRKSVISNLDFRYNCTNHSGNTGDALLFSEKIGAKLMHMEFIETVPFSSYSTGDLAHLGYLLYEGAILINKNGKRFSKENINRNILSENILSQIEQCGFILWDSTLEENYNYVDKFKDEVSRNIFSKNFGSFESLEKACEFMDIDFENLEKTISTYNDYVQNKEDLEFNRRNLSFKILKPPFYFFKISPSVHYTNGGLAINENAQVLNIQNIPIQNLFAAGEVTGGLHGGCCLSGTAISDSLVFGIIAAKKLFQEVQIKKSI